MHAPRRVRLALVAGALTILLPSAALAATVQDLVNLAEITYKMGCTDSATQVDCTHGTAPWTATIKPGSGAEEALVTRSREAPALDAAAANWMFDMHQTACGAPKEVDAFIDAVAALNDSSRNKTLGPTEIGNCTFTGSYTPSAITAPLYLVESVILPPSPTPVVTPSPTPTPTVKPTAKPTVKPGPITTPTPARTDVPATTQIPTIAPSAAGSAPASPAVNASPSAAPSLTPSLAPTVVPTATAGAGPVHTVGPAPTAVGGSPSTPAPSLPTFSASVLGVSDVNGDVGAVGGSLLLALILLLIIGFAGELFNNTVESNYTEISGWFRKGPLGRLRRLGAKLKGDARVSLLLFLVLTALVSSFVDPYFGLDLRSLAVFLGFLVGLVVVLASFKLPPILARRRRTGELGRLRPLPWALVIAVLFVLISRIGNLQPGYLYGIVLGAIFVTDVSDKDEGRETFYGSLWTLCAAVLAWLGLSWVRSLGYAEDGFGVTLLSTAFAAILVAGLEAAAFGLMPLRFMPGHAVYKWNRLGWGLLFGVSVFAFVHLLIGPTSGYVADLAPEAFMAALGIFAAFGALSIATWAFFRFRTKPTVDAADAT